MSSLEDRLDRIERKLDTLLAALKTNGGGARASASSSNGGGSASAGGDLDVDIDGPRGDPEVRFMPKRWTGADFKGQKFSACDPDFLDTLADAFEWFAQRDDEAGAVDKNGGPKSKWGRLDAARARAWANRLRGGAAPAALPPAAATAAVGTRATTAPPRRATATA
jgi:hypothetical protein